MRGPSAKPQCMAVGASLRLATSSSAARPGRARLPITRSPCVTSARFSPVSGITSQMVARATRSSSSRRSGSARLAKKPCRRNARSSAMQARNATAVAQIMVSPEPQSSRFGFTVARIAAGGPSVL